MACQRCLADLQPKNFGQPRDCAFGAEGNFVPRNWNCATLEALLMLPGSNWDSATIYGQDETMDVRHARHDGDYGGFIVLTRYKTRGCTSSAVHVGDFWPPEPLTLDRALKALGDVPEPDE